MNSGPGEGEANRRPLASRSSTWAIAVAKTLVRTGVSPNAISVASVFVAAAGACLIACKPSGPGLLGAAMCIQLRLLCNLFDGMVAIEGKRRSPTGGLYNEIPDRIADSLLIVALGYSIGQPAVGWYGALAAAVTAYIRVLGGALGVAQDFRGPMAKQHRMAILTAGCVLGALEWWLSRSNWALVSAAWVVAIGSTITCGTRTVAIAHRLNSR